MSKVSDIIRDIRALAADTTRSKEEREDDLNVIDDSVQEQLADLETEDDEEEILCEDCGEEIDNCDCDDEDDEEEEVCGWCGELESKCTCDMGRR